MIWKVLVGVVILAIIAIVVYAYIIIHGLRNLH